MLDANALKEGCVDRPENAGNVAAKDFQHGSAVDPRDNLPNANSRSCFEIVRVMDASVLVKKRIYLVLNRYFLYTQTPANGQASAERVAVTTGRQFPFPYACSRPFPMQFPERPTVYLDVSLMMGNRRNTGIQRVVRDLAAVAPQVCGEFRYNCRLIHCVGGQFYRLRYNLIDLASQDWVSRLVRRKLGRQLVNNSIPRFSSPLAPLEMDRVITLNATWDDPQWLPALSRLGRQCHISSVVHDLIPLTHPQFHTDELVRRFGEWFAGLAATVPNIVATSSVGRAAITDWLNRNSAATPRVSQFRLTSGLRAEDSPLKLVTASGQVGGIRESLQAYFSGEPVLLGVGTLEPRKNHRQLLDACDRLWAEGWKGRLLLIGAVGWKTEELQTRIAGYSPGQILQLTDATDQELSFAYRQADALIFPSWTEGFGLPIVEALEAKLPVILSDTEIHREVAGRAAAYFPLDDCNRLAELIRQHSHNRFADLRTQANQYSHVNCYESFRSLLCDAIVAGRGFEGKIHNTPPWLKTQKVA